MSSLRVSRAAPLTFFLAGGSGWDLADLPLFLDDMILLIYYEDKNINSY